MRIASPWFDRDQEAVQALLADKQKTQGVTRSRAPDEVQVVDLMEALRASLAPPTPAKAGRRRAAEERTAPVPRTASKKLRKKAS